MTVADPLEFFSARIPESLRTRVEVTRARLRCTVQSVVVEALTMWLAHHEPSDSKKGGATRYTLRIKEDELRAVEKFLLFPLNDDDKMLSKLLRLRLKHYDVTAPNPETSDDTRHR